MRLPDRLYVALGRVYRAQERLRREEGKRELERQDQRMRAYYADLSERHDMGTCGGASAGCRYVPCVPRVSDF